MPAYDPVLALCQETGCLGQCDVVLSHGVPVNWDVILGFFRVHLTGHFKFLNWKDTVICRLKLKMTFG
ncbi:hypothetical protein LOAG_10681, partial [Loa loa]